MANNKYPDESTYDAVTTCKDCLPDDPSGGNVVFGFDGFIDNVRTVGRSADQRIKTLDEFGGEVVTSAAANSSLSISWEQKGQRTGGHVSHLSRVFQKLNFKPTILGTCGDPLLDSFEQEFSDCTIYSLGDPGITDAIEFDDGKLMLMESGDMETLDWKSLEAKVGVETLVEELDGAHLFGIGYWSRIPALAGILDGLREKVFPRLSVLPEHVLLDPANIRVLERQKLDEIVSATRRLADLVEITVSANRIETKVLASSFQDGTEDNLAEDARNAFRGLGVGRFVGHGVTESVVVNDDGCTSVAVPSIESPELTTSAGDHFNAGVGLGLIEEFPDSACIALGNALAGEFVRTGETPSYSEVTSAVASYGDQFE